VPARYQAPHQLEIVGDSITCGYGDEGTMPTCSFSADTENAYLAYGAITARALNAELRTIAWGPADAVVINLGTNDFSKGDPGQAFVQAYETFLKRLRVVYPQAGIFCALGSMLTDPNLTTARGYLQKIVADSAAAGDSRVYFTEFATQDIGTDGAGCDYHPNLVTHRKMAQVLTQALHDKLGW
jgi:lysophospholipase L1-like esterase